MGDLDLFRGSRYWFLLLAPLLWLLCAEANADQCFGRVRMITKGICQESNYNLEFEALDLTHREVYIRWNIVDNPDETCKKLNRSGFKRDGTILACAVSDDTMKVCNIYTKNILSLAVLGHEVRHCFERDWHD
jgi:hypothetical protein